MMVVKVEFVHGGVLCEDRGPRIAYHKPLVEGTGTPYLTGCMLKPVLG